MDRTTQTISVEDRLFDLDFSAECEVEDFPIVNGRQTKCTNRAEWIGVSPCGHDSYFCGPHHCDGRSYTCNACGRTDTHLATYRWVRL